MPRGLRRLAAGPAIAKPECPRLGLDDFRTDGAEPLGSLAVMSVGTDRMAEIGIISTRMIPADFHQDVAVNAAETPCEQMINSVEPVQRGASDRFILDRGSLRPVIGAAYSAVACPFSD